MVDNIQWYNVGVMGLVLSIIGVSGLSGYYLGSTILESLLISLTTFGLIITILAWSLWHRWERDRAPWSEASEE